MYLGGNRRLVPLRDAFKRNNVNEAYLLNANYRLVTLAAHRLPFEIWAKI